MICNIVRIVHRMCKQGHKFTTPLDVKSIGDESLENPEVVPAVKQLDVKVEPEIKHEIVNEERNQIKEEVKYQAPVEPEKLNLYKDIQLPVYKEEKPTYYEEEKIPVYEEAKLPI